MHLVPRDAEVARAAVLADVRFVPVDCLNDISVLMNRATALQPAVKSILFREAVVSEDLLQLVLGMVEAVPPGWA